MVFTLHSNLKLLLQLHRLLSLCLQLLVLLCQLLRELYLKRLCGFRLIFFQLIQAILQSLRSDFLGMQLILLVTELLRQGCHCSICICCSFARSRIVLYPHGLKNSQLFSKCCNRRLGLLEALAQPRLCFHHVGIFPLYFFAQSLLFPDLLCQRPSFVATVFRF